MTKEEKLKVKERRKDIYTHQNANFQRIARRDKKGCLSDQGKEIEENNRMGKTRDLFQKIRDTKGTFHAKMGSIKNRNCMDLTEADDTTLTAESEEELKSLLMKMKEESEKAGLNLNIQKPKIMASGVITSWQIDGETVETVADFILGAPKSLQMLNAAMKLKDTYSLEGKLRPT